MVVPRLRPSPSWVERGRETGGASEARLPHLWVIPEVMYDLFDDARHPESHGW